MSEKVYGICETNKCRKEVVPKEDLLIIEISSISTGNVEIVRLPDGWSFMNTSVISKMFVRSDDSKSEEEYPTTPNGDILNVSIQPDNSGSVARIYFRTTHTDYLSVKCRLVLLKRNRLPIIRI